MTEAYAQLDWEIVDYQMYCLDPDIIDRQTNSSLLLRGPRPQNIQNGDYFICVGASQTFGRFCKRPFPAILEEKLELQAINISRGGAVPSFFSMNSKKLFEYINNAKFAIIQIMSCRGENNSLFESRGIGFYVKRCDGTSLTSEEAFKDLIEERDKHFIKKIVNETRESWVESYTKLLRQIYIPKVLFWFSTRKPNYTEGYDSVNKLFGEFPHLVNAEMVNSIKPDCDEYVECISSRGLPHSLTNRFSGNPTTVEETWGGIWRENWYYPSPEMHEDAAELLFQISNKYCEP
jgi:hypothetical protein